MKQVSTSHLEQGFHFDCRWQIFNFLLWRNCRSTLANMCVMIKSWKTFCRGRSNANMSLRCNGRQKSSLPNASSIIFYSKQRLQTKAFWKIKMMWPELVGRISALLIPYTDTNGNLIWNKGSQTTCVVQKVDHVFLCGFNLWASCGLHRWPEKRNMWPVQLRALPY